MPNWPSSIKMGWIFSFSWSRVQKKLIISTRWTKVEIRFILRAFETVEFQLLYRPVIVGLRKTQEIQKPCLQSSRTSRKGKIQLISTSKVNCKVGWRELIWKTWQQRSVNIDGSYTIFQTKITKKNKNKTLANTGPKGLPIDTPSI